MSPRHFFQRRDGMTLIEILLFLAIIAVVASVTIPILFNVSESKLLQETMAYVEINGTDILQSTTVRIRNAERIIAPTRGHTGSVLVLQMAPGELNPTIIATATGRLMIVEGSVANLISSQQVAVENLVFKNTSVTDDHPSVHISFHISRVTRLVSPRVYERDFETAISLFPNDNPQGDTCGCGTPFCVDRSLLEWYQCEYPTCNTLREYMDCEIQ